MLVAVTAVTVRPVGAGGGGQFAGELDVAGSLCAEAEERTEKKAPAKNRSALKVSDCMSCLFIGEIWCKTQLISENNFLHFFPIFQMPKERGTNNLVILGQPFFHQTTLFFCE